MKTLRLITLLSRQSPLSQIWGKFAGEERIWAARSATFYGRGWGRIALLLAGLLASLTRAGADTTSDPAGDPSAPPKKAANAAKTNAQTKPTPMPTNAGSAPQQSAPSALPDPTDSSTGRVRIKDIADVQGVRGNQLIGYGLVVGLDGTGDGQTSQFTIQSVANMLRRFGVTVPPAGIQLKNVAAVIITADLPAFVKNGNRIDVTVSSMGDAKSLQGGTLMQTPLRAANGEIYAVAQGALSIGGFNFGQGGSSVQKNHVAVGRIPRGAYVEQEVPTTLTDGKTVQITLRDPDFTTASRAAEAIRKQLPGVSAHAQDAATIAVSLPTGTAEDIIGFLARVETVSLTPDVPARIVVNERTGTVVMGGNVRLSPGAIAHGGISVKIENTPVVVPPAPFNNNPGIVVPLKDTSVEEKTGKLAGIPATTTVDQLVHALNTLGVTPRDLIAILQAMHAAGMISSDIEIQ
ncbi:MAG TPA: flagellar basal body P-ring protein FlgI [Chthonomonadaceae bacterium]|nr:flagellar basal body P-ring protein FlgI [Chthonomonadaceae bacterium]